MELDPMTTRKTATDATGTLWLPGDIGATTGTAFLSRLIQFGQHLHGDAYWKWNHIFVVVGPNGETVEALGKGVVRSNVANHGEQLNVGCPEGVDRTKVCEYALSRLGTEYGYFDDFLLGVDCLAHAHFAWRGDSLICSELGALSLVAGGWKGLRQPPERTMPGDLVYQMQPRSLLAGRPGIERIAWRYRAYPPRRSREQRDARTGRVVGGSAR